ncbi:hypothetical protein O6H91_07G013000 [Diphasiastrum complanatum]|nr:hypothetical protein O6H91_07G013000 [Diphasiastrum complanatum]
MGTGEAVTPTKTAKISAQDQPSAPSSYAEWAAAFQAFYNGATPPPGYFPPGIAPGGQPHPYMWAGQPVVPPYGTAPPYSAMYPGGHAYGHPSMPQGPHPFPYGIMSPGSAIEAAPAVIKATTSEADCKSSDGKEQSPLKKSKGITDNRRRTTKKVIDNNKGTSASPNGALSQSGESGSDGSSDGSDEDNGKNMLHKRSSEQISEGGSIETASHSAGQTGNQLIAQPTNVGGRPPGGLVPTTGLNVGVDYWAAASQGATAAGKGKHNPVMTQALMPTFPNGPYLGAVGREGGASDHWIQDERELKRQKRKQSNRESARRSRLRKQAECEELAARVDSLTVENLALRTEISRLVEERNKLSTENSTLVERLKKVNGDEAGDEKDLGSNEVPYGQLQRQENGKTTDSFSAEHLRAQGGNGRSEESS